MAFAVMWAWLGPKSRVCFKIDGEVKLKKHIIASAALAASIAASAPASAAVYNYNTYIGNGIGRATLTIDTIAGTASYKGGNIDVTMTGNSIKNFQGGTRPDYKYFRVDDIQGTFTRYGRTYTAYPSTSPKHTSFAIGFDSSSSTPQNFFWTYGRDSWGRTLDFDGKGWNSTSSTGGSTSTGGTTTSTSTGGSTSSTSTGGSTSTGSTSTGSSTSTSTGGTPVPAPAALVLFGLGAAGLFGRRKFAKKNLK